MNALEAVNVTKRYSNQTVLDDFSLSVEPGSFVSLMGPSGSGKSTFLHIAAGLTTPDSGRVVIDGEDVVSMSDSTAAKFRRRHTGVVFQSYNLLPSLSVAENIVLPVKLDHRAVDKARLGELAEKLSLGGILGKLPSELSGGERQRVAIARALFLKPAVILADEPTGNLDIPASRSICGLLKSLNETERSAVLLVTHEPAVAASAQKVFFLKDGRIGGQFVPDGDPAAVSERYIRTFC